MRSLSWCAAAPSTRNSFGSSLWVKEYNFWRSASRNWAHNTVMTSSWTDVRDSSADVNWYTKRLTLSSVYSATVLYWLGDNSPNHQDTWTFLDRRIENVMQFEKFKAQVNANPLAKQLLAGPNWLLSKIKAPSGVPTVDLPGNWSRRS